MYATTLNLSLNLHSWKLPIKYPEFEFWQKKVKKHNIPIPRDPPPKSQTIY
jgi:hypothetical protein